MIDHTEDDELDAILPKELRITTDKPQGKKPVSQRMMLLFGGLGVAIIAIIIYTLAKTSTNTSADHAAQIKQETASAAAQSPREGIQKKHEDEAHPGTFKRVDDVYNSDSDMQTHPTLVHTDSTTPAGVRVVPASVTTTPTTLSPIIQAQIDFEKERLKEDEAARSAPIDSNQNSASSHSPVGEPAPVQTPPAVDASAAYGAELSNLMHAAQSPGGIGSARLGLTQSGYANQNDQDGKREFTQRGPADKISSRVDPPSQFTLLQGTHIPAVLDGTINSDQPGEVTALVLKDVYDSKTGKYVLIPAGSKVLGEYNSNVAYAQSRVQVAWTRIIFPDTTSRTIGKMMGYSEDGSSGLHDKVNNHLKRLIGGVALTSLLSAGVQLSQNHAGNNSVLAYPSTGQIIGASIGQQASTVGSQLTARNMNVQPTIVINKGKAFYINVNADIPFDGPYQPR